MGKRCVVTLKHIIRSNVKVIRNLFEIQLVSLSNVKVIAGLSVKFVSRPFIFPYSLSAKNYTDEVLVGSMMSNDIEFHFKVGGYI